MGTVPRNFGFQFQAHFARRPTPTLKTHSEPPPPSPRDLPSLSPQIAQKELREKKIPFTIRRYLPDGSYEDWAVHELIVVDNR